MPRLKKLKTLILGLLVILITFTVFVALPNIIPPLNQVSSDIVMWACSQRGKPQLYDTWIWHSNDQPDKATIEKVLRDVVTTEGILFGLKKADYAGGRGTLDITVDPENENLVLVSGYLQYGSFAESESETDVMSLPVPKMIGTLGKRIVKVILTDIFENERTETDYVVATDNDGLFSLILEPNTNALCYRIEVGFEDEMNVPEDPKKPITVYWGCREAYTTCVENIEFDKTSLPWWVWVLLGMAVIIFITVLCWLYKKHRPRYLQEKVNLRSQVETIIPKTVKQKTEESGGNVIEVSIVYSDIEKPMPSVWGVNESLTFKITFRDSNGKKLVSQPGEVDSEESAVVQITSDRKGNSTLYHFYRQKGEYTIKAGYKDKQGKEISSWRTIRIVDYREEMVRLFGEMLERLNLSDVRIEPDMTPREVEWLLSERLENVSKESLRRVIDGFEEANYSTHPVNRESYVRMYRAIGEIMGGKLNDG